MLELKIRNSNTEYLESYMHGNSPLNTSLLNHL